MSQVYNPVRGLGHSTRKNASRPGGIPTDPHRDRQRRLDHLRQWRARYLGPQRQRAHLELPAAHRLQRRGGGGGSGGGSVLVFASNSGLGSLTINAKGGDGATTPEPPAAWPAPAPTGRTARVRVGSGAFVALTASPGISVKVAGGSSGLSSGNPASSPALRLQLLLGDARSTPSPPDPRGASPDAMRYPSLTVLETTGQTSTVRGGSELYHHGDHLAGYGTGAGVTLADPLPGLPSPFTYAATNKVTLSGGATRTSTANPAAGSTAPN